jgi:hypothetical protein
MHPVIAKHLGNARRQVEGAVAAMAEGKGDVPSRAQARDAFGTAFAVTLAVTAEKHWWNDTDEDEAVLSAAEHLSAIWAQLLVCDDGALGLSGTGRDGVLCMLDQAEEQWAEMAEVWGEGFCLRYQTDANKSGRGDPRLFNAVRRGLPARTDYSHALSHASCHALRHTLCHAMNCSGANPPRPQSFAPKAERKLSASGKALGRPPSQTQLQEQKQKQMRMQMQKQKPPPNPPVPRKKPGPKPKQPTMMQPHAGVPLSKPAGRPPHTGAYTSFKPEPGSPHFPASFVTKPVGRPPKSVQPVPPPVPAPGRDSPRDSPREPTSPSPGSPALASLPTMSPALLQKRVQFLYQLRLEQQVRRFLCHLPSSLVFRPPSASSSCVVLVHRLTMYIFGPSSSCFILLLPSPSSSFVILHHPCFLRHPLAPSSFVIYHPSPADAAGISSHTPRR